MKNKTGIAVFAAAAVFLAACATTGPKQASTPKPQVVTVESEGVGALAGDIAKSRQNAVNDAQKRAVELVVGTYISAETMVSKAKVIDSDIIGQTEGFIEKYDILKESQDENFYRVRIKAWVRKEDLNKKISELDLAPKDMLKPVVSFWLKESIDGKGTDDRTAENELAKIFVDAGYLVSDVKPAEYFKDESSLVSAGAGLEDKLKSDIVVLGEASSNFNTDQNMGGFISYRAITSLKVVKNATGEVILTVNDTAGGVDVNKENAGLVGIANVAKKAGREMPDKINKYLTERLSGNVKIKNVANVNELNTFIKRLRLMAGVKDAWVRSYDGGVALIDVNLKGTNFVDVAKKLRASEIYKVNKIETYYLEIEKTGD
jgi:hypothetical protein